MSVKSFKPIALDSTQKKQLQNPVREWNDRRRKKKKKRKSGFQAIGNFLIEKNTINFQGQRSRSKVTKI